MEHANLQMANPANTEPTAPSVARMAGMGDTVATVEQVVGVAMVAIVQPVGVVMAAEEAMDLVPIEGGIRGCWTGQPPLDRSDSEQQQDNRVNPLRRFRRQAWIRRLRQRAFRS